MDRRTTSVVETTHYERPAIGVPGPESDRVVDNGRPNEDEDDGGENAHAVDGSTDSEGRAMILSVGGEEGSRYMSNLRDGGKHALVKTEHQIRKIGTAD